MSLEKDQWNWRDEEIPDCIPYLSQIPVPDNGIKYNLMKYFPDYKLFVFFLPAEEVIFDDDIVFCFGLNKETESRTNRCQFQERGINDVEDDESKNSLFMFQLSQNLYECPLEIEEIETNKYRVIIKSGLSRKKIFIQNGYKRKGPWRPAEVSFETMSIRNETPMSRKLENPPFPYENTIENTEKLHEIILTHKDYRSREDTILYKSWLVYSKAKYEIAKNSHGRSIAGVISSYLKDSINQAKYEEIVDSFATEEDPLLGERLLIEAYFLTFIGHRDDEQEGINGHRTIFSHFLCNLTEVWRLAQSNM
ncbi:unnamed protein product [Oikopleura dioica]|uniref:Uncharacterized protein n=1 Tax=Oikopleura dioica TaxID=34765 RepID=E4YA85_OIKDI|nr:unnamed protein product [Oikopleura dioica]